MMALNEEYKLRWQKDKDHTSITKLSQLLSVPPVNARIDVIGTDATPQCLIIVRYQVIV